MVENTVSKEEEQLIRNHFEEMDDSGDGVLSKEEIKEGCQKLELPMTDKEIEIIFKEYDRDKSGTLDFDEFLLAMSDRNKAKKKSKIKCKLKRSL